MGVLGLLIKDRHTTVQVFSTYIITFFEQQIKKNALSHISEISCNNPGIIFRQSSKIL